MNINLHIERLVLDGVTIAPGQHQLLQSIVASELIRMLRYGGFSPSLAQGGSLSRISGKDILLTGNDPTHLGRQIAYSISGSIGHE
ncbi:hypothetical protein [Methylomicrobium sp. Wu6]|uniref:hypothetical protein n=1 Tax=Methylomicrobium sp. Wu6 TaxID=3107928 RepID=UPI002DD6593E|nr:hypothetical protein [Methylomicrobium sp. Wu6]MEC4748960.1 hypothetical protein [Methylomicrobium sp. Wu6]